MPQCQSDDDDQAAFEPTHRQMLASINLRLDGLVTTVGQVKTLATQTHDQVMRIKGERTAEQRAADRAAMAEAVRPAAAPTPATGLRRWSAILAIIAAGVAILGGLGAAVKISIEVGQAVVKALTAGH